jgi:hypothetical protein
MDYRWRPVSRDSAKATRVFLHPTAAPHEVRAGIDPGSDDSIDLSPYLTQGSHTAFDANVTLKFNRELFGSAQPAPNQILEVQLYQDGAWKPIWIGVIDSISSFTQQRGERSMQLIAKSLDSQDIWRNSKRVTPLFPQLTDFTYIIQRIARSVGMRSDEIALPPSAMTTAHSNTQLADMNAWDMVTAVAQPLGWTPFIDGVGRLRVADRSLMGRNSDVVLTDDRIISIGGQRQKPPASRVRVKWLNPTLKKHKMQQRKLRDVQITMGWWLPYWRQSFYFSDDQTLRAENTYFHAEPSVNTLGLAFVEERYEQLTENQGKLLFDNPGFVLGVAALVGGWTAAHFIHDNVVTAGVGATTGVTIPFGRLAEAGAQATLMLLMIAIGTGNYEIWGTPFEWTHARNVSEAFDATAPLWVDNVVEIESDFIVNEEHAKSVAIRELIYSARAANKWSLTIVDDPRIEYGDIIGFGDGQQLYVEDFTRKLERGTEAVLDVTGFLVGPTAGVSAAAGIPIGPSGPGESPDEGGPGTGGSLGVPAIGKDMRIGWFEFVDPPFTLAYDPPGNCAMWVDDALKIRDTNSHSGAQFALWVQTATDVADLEAQVAASSWPCVVYWDDRDWPSWPTLRPGDWICLQAYCHNDETPAQFEAAMIPLINAVPDEYANICLVCQCYTSNTNNTEDLIGIVPVYARLARDNPRVTMLLVFSDQGRATGMVDHPDVQPYWTELFEGANPDGFGDGGGESEGPGGPATIPDYSAIVSSVEAMFNRVVPASQREQAKAQFTRQVAWSIYQIDPNIGLLEKTGGTQVMNMSTDIVVQLSNGAFADVCTDPQIAGGNVQINGTWAAKPPDVNTSDHTRWIRPTAALANAPGPMTRI